MKKWLSLLLVLCLLVGILAGCGPAVSEEPDPVNPGSSSNVPEDPSTPTVPEDPTEIVVAIMCFAPVDSAVQDRIENVVNEKMVDMINVKADLMWFDAATYLTQVPMMLQSNETLDVIAFTPIPVAGFSAFMGQSQLMDISEYIDEYGPDIKAALGEYGLAATSKGDAVYGAGFLNAFSGGQAICMRTDVLEAIGMLDEFNNMTTWTEFEAIMAAAVAAGYPGLANSDAEGTVLNPQPYVCGPDNFADALWLDVGGDGNQQIYIDPADDTVKCYYASESYRDSLIRAGDWYNKGLIYRDASTAEDYADTQIKNGVGSAMIKALEFGWEDTLAASCGYPMSVHFVAESQLATATYTKFGWGVPVYSQEPEAAVKFINLLYSENDVHNTLVWGEEGVDWVRSEAGTAVYPNGATSAEYHAQEFLFGNVLATIPWGENSQLREQQAAANETVEASKYIGFAIDNTAVANQVTACQAISNQYKPMLSAGAYGDQTAAMWQEYIDALEAAGINEVIAEYQRQLDEWLAAK